MVKRGKSNFIKINEEEIVFSKKGLSNIVATLLIILLVIVAAGIIWVVIRNVVQEGSESIELGKFTLDLQIERAQIQDGDVTVVVVRRNPGKGDFIGMNFIFYDGENTEIIREDTILKETEVRSFTFTLTQISTSNLKTISIAPIFRLSSGKESVGDVTGIFDVSRGIQIGTEEQEPQTNFEILGFRGTGTVDYTISGGQGQINFTRAIVEPLDVLPGHIQTFTVHIASTYPIISVTSFTQLDNSNSTLIFEKISENEIWSVSWIVDDVHTTTYRTSITATDSEGNSDSVSLTWTDSCQAAIAHGADRTISTNCTTGANSIGGLDGGSLTIAAGVTMTIDSNSTWAFNDGKSITLVGGRISMGGGSISKGYLHYYDADGDGYAPNTTVLFSASSSLSNATRAKDMTTLPTSSAYTIDCCDTDANARPYQENYFTTPRIGCGGYNYSCNPWSSVPTKEWTVIGNCYVCWWDSPMLYCDFTASGAIGWDGSPVPDCGVSTNYITDPGLPCDQRRDFGEAVCLTDCYHATIESRTQACR